MHTLLNLFARCLPLVIVCLAVFPICGQDETPVTRLFDTGVASAQPLADEAVAKRAGWTLVPEDKVDHPFSGDAVLLNDKLAVVLRKQGHGAEVYSKAAGGREHRASVGHVGGNSAMTAGALKIVENNSSAVMVQETGKDKASVALSFRLTTGEAILEIRSNEGAESVGVQSKARYVVVPDYFGDDVVFETDALTQLGGRRDTTPTSANESGARVTRSSELLVDPVPEGRVRRNFLPAENFCLHLLDGDAIMMSVWQSSEQEVWLAAPSADRQGDLCSSQIRCLKGKSIWLAFLESAGLWHAGTVSAKDEWKPPFPAKWRCSLTRENGVAESWNWERGPGRDSHPPAPSLSPTGREGPRGAGEGDSVLKGSRHDGERLAAGPLLVYPIDRSTTTPLTITCPTDVMRNTLGVGPCQYILACEGLGARGDPTPNAVMNWVEKQFEAKKEKKAADDIKERLELMTEHVAQARKRMERYAEFAGQVRKRLANKPGFEHFRSIVDDLDRFVVTGLAPTASPERAEQVAAEVSALIGKVDARADCQRLGEQLRAIGTVQDGTLARCRMAVRRLRAQGRTLTANQPPETSFASEIQHLAEQMLKGKSASSGNNGGAKP